MIGEKGGFAAIRSNRPHQLMAHSGNSGVQHSNLLAVASRGQARADEYAIFWHIPCAHGSYEAII
jgi:hypothetical protein